MAIRKATILDLPAIMPVYSAAKQFMAESGNPNQWIGGYPSEADIESDINAGYCHVAEESGEIAAAFALIPGNDPTYEKIYDGQWLNEKPYAAVHRLASSGKHRGMGCRCLEWCLEKHGNIRVDTHPDNKTMLRIIQKMRFVRCGIIFTHNGTKRIAFQRDLSGE